MERRFARGPVERAPQGLAIDRHHTLQALAEALHEADEAALERRGIEQPEHAAERVMARDAETQLEELPQERLLGLTEQRHVRAILAAAQHGAQRDHQDLMQVVPRILLPGVDHLGKAGTNS